MTTKAQEARYRLFATAYLRNGANGVAAARAAGYKGKPDTLAVTASRLLRHAKVRALLDEKLDAAEAKITTADGEVMTDAEVLARLTTQGRSSLAPFIQFITPEQGQAAIEACGTDQQRARNVLRLIEGRGFYLDVERAIKEGHGDVLSEMVMGQDAMGFPEVKIKVRDPLGALTTLAKIKGLLREKAAPPPTGNGIVLGLVLAELPTADLLKMRKALLEAAGRAQAITVEAQRV